MPVLARGAQRCETVVVGKIELGPRLNKDVDDVSVPLLRSHREGTRHAPRLQAHIRPRAQERGYDLDVPTPTGEHDSRRLPRAPCRVHPRAAVGANDLVTADGLEGSLHFLRAAVCCGPQQHRGLAFHRLR